METALNGDFSPKSAIISKNTTTKKIFFLILSNYIIRDGLSLKNISRYCPFKGAQAWDIRRRDFYWNQACMGRWLRN